MSRIRTHFVTGCTVFFLFGAFAACEEAPTDLSSPQESPEVATSSHPTSIQSTPNRPRVEAMSRARSAVKPWNQGFETDASGWFDGEAPGGNPPIYGSLSRVRSGTGGIRSSSGRVHLSVGPDDDDLIFSCSTLLTGNCTSGPFSFFADASGTWPRNGWVAEMDVYLDPSWPDGTGFDYSVASADPDVSHDRDYIFHVVKDLSTSALLVGASNNSGFSPRQDLETINHFEVQTAGWYTLRHVFRNEAGELVVDMELKDKGKVLFRETRQPHVDQEIPAEVGGNLYSWFVYLTKNFDDMELAADNHRLKR